jgi:hypothetical protein
MGGRGIPVLPKADLLEALQRLGEGGSGGGVVEVPVLGHKYLTNVALILVLPPARENIQFVFSREKGGWRAY